ncbi:MAG: type II toxin-antitoxin system antitoxin SocA domain-containing protein [Bacteroidota bacterium]
MSNTHLHNENWDLKQDWTHYTFRKEEFPVCQLYFVDKRTGDEFTTEAQDALVLKQAHNLYRSKYHIPFPVEIKAIREKYGLSALKMAEVLDFGVNSYRQYEQGEIPSLANAKLIRLAGEPSQFLRFLEEKKDRFSPKAYEQTLEKIRLLQHPDKLEPVVDYIWNFHTEANEFTGFVKPQLKKVAHYVMFFAEKAKPMKTRLNKLLFFGDFLHFRQTGFAISGCNYRAIPYGPVPSHFHELFGLLEDQGFIRIESEMSENGNLGERFRANQAFDASLFSEEELAHMEKVVEAFAEVRTKDLIELSHAEKGWQENHAERSLINYQNYAFHLQSL